MIARQTVGRPVEKAATNDVLAIFWLTGRAQQQSFSTTKLQLKIALCKIYMITILTVGRAVEKAETNGVFAFFRPTGRSRSHSFSTIKP